MVTRTPNPLSFSGSPLANDDVQHRDINPLQFSGQPSGLGLSNPGSPLGLQPMQGVDSNAFMDQLGSTIASGLPRPVPQQQGRFFYSPSTGEMVVNGFQFNEQNASRALVSEEFARGPQQNFTLPDTVSDWEEMAPEDYANYIEGIRNPGWNRRMDEAWEHAWRGVGDVAVGAGLAVDELDGDIDNQWLQHQRENILQAYENNAPFMLALRDVQNPEDAATYTAQMFIQGVPWLVETIASMTAGALIGGALTGGAGAPAGAVEAFIAKEGLRRATMALLRNNISNGARAYAAAAQAAGRGATRNQILSRVAAESADDAARFANFSDQVFRNSRRGATIAAAGANYMTGVGDIRNTVSDAGADTTTADAIGNIWGMAIPYAAVETLGDLILTQPLTHIIPSVVAPSARRGALRFGENALRQGAVNMLSEGVQEGSQYIFGQQAVAGTTEEPIDINPQDLLESAVGGAIAGGGLGAMTSVFTPRVPGPQTPTTTTPVTPTPTPSAPTYDESQSMGGMEVEDNPYDASILGVYDGSTPVGEERELRTNAIEDEGEYQITGQPLRNSALEERERLRAVINNPATSFDERRTAQQALGMLNMPDEVDYEAAQRGADAVGSGTGMVERPLPQYGPGYEAPGLAEELTSIRQEIEGRQEDTYSYPGALSANPTNTSDLDLNLPRGPEQILMDLNAGKPVTLNEVDVLREAVRQEMYKNPTEPGFTQVLQQLDRYEHTQSLKEQGFTFPEPTLAPIPQEPVRAGPLPPNQYDNPIMPDGLPKYGKHRLKPAVGQDGLRSRTEEPTIDPLGMIDESKKVAEKQLQKRQREEQKTREKAKNKATTDADRNFLREERRKDQPRKGLGRNSQSIQDNAVNNKPELIDSQESRQAADIFADAKAPKQNTNSAEKFKAEEKGPFLTNENRKPERNRLQEAGDRIKEAKDAVQKPSAERTPSRKQSRPVQEAGRGDSAGDRPAAKSSNPNRFEGVQEPELTATQRTLMAQLIAAAKAQGKLKRKDVDPRQKASGVLTKFDTVKNPQPWTIVNGEKVERDDVLRLVHWFDWKKNNEGADGAKLKRFHRDIRGAWVDNRGDPKGFAEWVKFNEDEARTWLASDLSSEVPPVRAAAEAALPKSDKPQRAVDRPGSIRPPTIVTTILRRELAKNPDFTFRSIHPATRERSKAIIKEINEAQRAAGLKESSEQAIYYSWAEVKSRLRRDAKKAAEANKPKDNNTPSLEELQRMRDNPKQAAADTSSYDIVARIDQPDFKPMKKSEVQNIVKQVQQRIYQDFRFKSTHVFSTLEDFWNRAENEVITLPNGQKHTLAHYVKRQAALLQREVPAYKDLTEAEVAYIFVDQRLKSRAVVLQEYGALLVFAGHMESKREVYEILEHEYLTHKGLSALFKDPEERRAFLGRLYSVPGMIEKRKALVAMYKGYAQVSELDQVEEVMAFHMMEGPLALEMLLSAPQAFDPKTKQSLWETFKAIVMRWANEIFGGFRSTEAQALDAITMAMREYAVTGKAPDLQAVLDPFAAMSREEIDAIISGAPLSDIKRALDTVSPEDTQKLLYNTENDPGRPYRRTNYAEDMIDVIKSQEELIVKLREIGSRGAVTPVKEGLKKVGRAMVTTNQMQLESPLVEKVMDIMENTIKEARSIITEVQNKRGYSYKSEELAAMRKIWGDKIPGSTKAERVAYGRLALLAVNNKLAQISEDVIKAAPRLLTRHPDGTYTINMSVFEELLKEGTFSKEDFENGIEQFTVDDNGNVNSVGVHKTDQATIDLGYDIYVQETRHLAESSLGVLKAAADALSMRNDQAVHGLIKQGEFSASDKAFVDEALQRMFKLYADIAFEDYNKKTFLERGKQQDKARQVLAELMRTFHKEDKVTDWTDSTKKRKDTHGNPRLNDAFKWREQEAPDDEVKPYVGQIRWFLEQDELTGKTRFHRLNSLGIGDTRQYQMLGVFQDLVTAEALAHQQENETIQSVLGNYIEMTRKGGWRVAVEAIDPDTGLRADISPEFTANMLKTYTESQREAIDLQEELGEALAGVYTVRNGEGQNVRVKFDVSVGMAPGEKTMSGAPKIKEFLAVAEAVGVKLSAPQMKNIANLIESVGNRKRFGLQRSGTPGMDADIMENNSKTITSRAWQAAKIKEAWMLDRTLSDSKNIYGDWDKLKLLQRNFDIANRGAPEGMPAPLNFVRNEDAVTVAELVLLRYANQLRHAANHSLKRPTVNIRTTKGEQKLSIKGEGQAHLKYANALKASLDKDQLELNLNDLLSKTGALRQMGVVQQLGTIAAGIMNSFTPIISLPWVLMARHGTTGFGGAFTFAEVIHEIITAMTQVMPVWQGLSDTTKLLELIEAAKKGDNTTGLSLAELEFIYKETLNGKLNAQQTYSLTGGTESNIRDLLWRNLSEILLKPFSSVEAATRRVAALTTYRLAKGRYMRAGDSQAALEDQSSDEYKKLVKDVEYIIDHSQGNYANINRPELFRGDWSQYIAQYKMFPLTMVLLINNLPLAQKGAMLGVIFMLSGLKGEPFADDFADIYDTLLQKLGFKHDSVELQLTQFFEEIMPGSSNWIMHGAIDRFSFGGTMSSRLSMGDNIPLTGVFREGADIGREVLNAFGPAFAANMDAVEWAWTLTDFMIQQTGLKPNVTNWEELVRKFPQGQLRAFGEAGMMLSSGQITDPRGRLVSDEVDVFNIMTRALGFYPLEASKANNAVRLDRMHTGYMRSVRARFILAYAHAYRQGNDERMESILDSVRDWNEAAEMTGQEDMLIRNFRSAAVRAGRAASSTTIERTSQGAPDYSLIDELAGILNADEESDR